MLRRGTSKTVQLQNVRDIGEKDGPNPNFLDFVSYVVSRSHVGPKKLFLKLLYFFLSPKSPKMTEESSEIETPHEHDVLSGRGNYVNYHAGNEYFRALVRKYKVDYVKCPKPQKGKWSKIIYDEIKARDPPGRFLKQDSTTKLWVDIGEKKALDKTRQALREGAPELAKEMSGEDEGGPSEGDEVPNVRRILREKILYFRDSHFLPNFFFFITDCKT